MNVKQTTKAIRELGLRTEGEWPTRGKRVLHNDDAFGTAKAMVAYQEARRK